MGPAAMLLRMKFLWAAVNVPDPTSAKPILLPFIRTWALLGIKSSDFSLSVASLCADRRKEDTRGEGYCCLDTRWDLTTAFVEMLRRGFELRSNNAWAVIVREFNSEFNSPFVRLDSGRVSKPVVDGSTICMLLETLLLPEDGDGGEGSTSEVIGRAKRRSGPLLSRQ